MPSLTKRFKYKVYNENPDVVREEIDNMKDLANNVVFEINNGKEPPNKMEMIEGFDQGLVTPLDHLGKYLKYIF